MQVGDIVRPRTCGQDHPYNFGPAIVTEFSNVEGGVYVRRPFEPHMVYVFRIEDLEVVYTARAEV